MGLRLLPIVAVLAVAASACGSSPSAAPSPSVDRTMSTSSVPASAMPVAPTVASLTAAIRAAVPQVGKVVTITESNDPNGLIGRPSGYVAAAVLYDSRVTCSDGLGADCGAMIEQWPDAQAASDRMDYIQGILKGSPMLGTEYDYAVGDLLIRVAGDLKPSEAASYAQVVTESPSAIASTEAVASSLRAAVQSYSDAYLTGKADAAFALLSKTCQVQIGHRTFVQVVTAAGEQFGHALPLQSFSSKPVDGTNALVTYTFAVNSIDQKDQRWTLDDGGWKYDAC